MRKNNTKEKHNTMLIGAGEAASELLHDMGRQKTCTMEISCIIDDDSRKWGSFLEGVEIVGGRDKILEIVKRYGIEHIIFGIPSASTQQRKEILALCNKTGCKLKMLPSLYQLVNPDVDISLVRDVHIEDLLGREQSKADLEKISVYLKGKTIMVTGGGGSIGSELCRQIAKAEPARLIIFDIYENNAYEIQQELVRDYPKLELDVLIGSVRNLERVESVVKKYRPEIIYHAAAHKHVPLMENSPHESIKNNVFGTYNVAVAAMKHDCERVVLISTDKAVNPTNIMGASKRLCEMIIQVMNRKSKTDFVAVRFGNVLGSSGSVIPLFKKQIENGGPVTVTHPDIIRFFMTILEAVSLVLEAGADAQGGEIFVLDMGEPVRIADMAENLIRLSGYEPGREIEIEYTGLRPGEKLYEEILLNEENLRKTKNQRIYITQPLDIDDDTFEKQLKRLEEQAYDENSDIKKAVSLMVPEYCVYREKEDVEV